MITFSGFCRFRLQPLLKTCVGKKRTGFFWNITKRMVMFPYRLFGATCRPNPMGPTGCTKSAVLIYITVEARNQAYVGKLSISVSSTIISTHDTALDETSFSTWTGHFNMWWRPSILWGGRSKLPTQVRVMEFILDYLGLRMKCSWPTLKLPRFARTVE